jgi:two-component system, OmpR family, phosphate regulon sensor histidine kinase PhoR
MKEQNVLRLLIPLSLVAMLGLLVLQLHLLQNVYDQKEAAFDQNVMSALERVTRNLESREVRSKVNRFFAGNSPFAHISPLTPGTNPETSESPGSRSSSWSSGAESVTVAADSVLVIRTGPRLNGTGDPRQSKLEVVVQEYGQYGPIPRAKVTHDEKPGERSFHQEFEWEQPSGSSITRFRSEARRLPRLRTEALNDMFATTGIPIEHVVTAPLVDSLLRKSLTEAGIDISPEFGIVAGDSVHMMSSASHYDDVRTSPFRTALFPGDPEAPASRLAVFFPNRKLFLFRQMAPSLLATVGFMLIVIFSFSYTVRTIYRQKRLSILLTEFVNNMTHEFKTPISTITVAADTMAIPEVAGQKDRLQHYVSIIRDEIGRMRTQVDRILQMAVLEEGDEELKLMPVDIHGILEDIARTFLIRIEHRDGTLHVSLEAMKHTISGNAFHLTNIFHNLLDNADKYSPGKPSIGISTRDEGNDLVVSVSDRGIGIPEGDQKQVFDKYYRVSTGNIHNVKGFGLGLSYVKTMVEAHRGTITLDSSPGKGTTMTVRLPLLR